MTGPGAATVRSAGGSLVRRLVLLAAAWSIAVLVVAGLALSTFFNQAATARFDDALSDSIDGMLAGASVVDGRIVASPFIDPSTLRAYSGRYWEIARPARGELHALARSRSLWDRALAPPPDGLEVLARAPGKVIYYDAPGFLGERLRVAALQGRLPEIRGPIIFMAAEDRSSLDRNVHAFATRIAIALLLLGAGLIAAVVLQVRIGLRPLFALRREVAGLRTGESERVVGTYPVELAPLAGELNALMVHNQEVLDRQRTHVGNLAHALKTPLSVILAETGQRSDQMAELIGRQASIMREQIDHHLRRARAAARAKSAGERTPVAPVLDELSRTLEKIFDNRLTIAWSCPDGLDFHGERQDLLEIAGNAMENACKWGRARVRVGAAATSNRRFLLTVEDDGPGLAAEQRSAVLRRGTRLDEGAPGSGLGLSIVDELVRAYDGALEMSDSGLGGLRLDLTLPLAGAPGQDLDPQPPGRPGRKWRRARSPEVQP